MTALKPLPKRVIKELQKITRYASQILALRIQPSDTPSLSMALGIPPSSVAESASQLASACELDAQSPCIILDGSLTHVPDLLGTLSDLHAAIPRGGRIVAVLHSPYIAWLADATRRALGREQRAPGTFLTEAALRDVAKLSSLEVVRLQPAAFIPWRLGGAGDVINSLLCALPFFRRLATHQVLVLRPKKAELAPPSLSIVVPARNERGTINRVLGDLPAFPGVEVEVIFVEGHSHDGTWAEIQDAIAHHGRPWRVRAFRQPGVGKGDAVRLGFSHATGDLLAILDADATVPPECLSRFYDAYRSGAGDFINGDRLLYPMEPGAMRPLNRLGNIFFAKAVGFILDCPLGDTLCGTKLLRRHDYERMRSWRQDFGDFDPFGDFELLFPAAIFGLGIVDLPVPYRARTYGETNISRFRHGWQLLRMVLVGLLRIRG